MSARKATALPSACMATAALFVALVSGALAVPTAALAKPTDVTASHAYLQADLALSNSSKALEVDAQANVALYIERIARECGGVGAEAPQDEEQQALSTEAAGALWSVLYGTDVKPIARFARAVTGIHWSNPRLTRIAHAYATSLRSLATLSLPNLCGDVSAWKASGYSTVPASTIGFDRHEEAIQPHAVPQRLLAPFEQPADRATARLIASLEFQLEGNEFTLGFEDWITLLTKLGLHQ